MQPQVVDNRNGAINGAPEGIFVEVKNPFSKSFPSYLVRKGNAVEWNYVSEFWGRPESKKIYLKKEGSGWDAYRDPECKRRLHYDDPIEVLVGSGSFRLPIETLESASQ